MGPLLPRVVALLLNGGGGDPTHSTGVAARRASSSFDSYASPLGGDNAMNGTNYDFQSGYTSPSSEGFALGTNDILATLRQDWRFPVFGCLIGVTLAAAYIIFVPTPYKTTARILLDSSVNRYLQINKIVGEPISDEREIGSQVYILSSESIVVPVVRSMNLAHDSEFVGSAHAGDAQSLGHIDTLIKIVEQSIGWNGDADAAIDPDAVLERTAVETFLKNLSVSREDVANVIDVTF